MNDQISPTSTCYPFVLLKEERKLRLSPLTFLWPKFVPRKCLLHSLTSCNLRIVGRPDGCLRQPQLLFIGCVSLLIPRDESLGCIGT